MSDESGLNEPDVVNNDSGSDQGSEEKEESDGENLNGVDSVVDEADGDEEIDKRMEMSDESGLDESVVVNNDSGPEEENSAGGIAGSEDICAGCENEAEDGGMEIFVDKVDPHRGVRSDVVNKGQVDIPFDEGKLGDECESNSATPPHEVVGRSVVLTGDDGYSKTENIACGSYGASDFDDDSEDPLYLPDEEELDENLSSNSENLSSRYRGATGMKPRMDFIN